MPTVKSWKRAETRAAKAFGAARRRGPTGRDDNDFEHALISPEVKYRKALPKFLIACLEQARTARSCAGKIPVTIFLAHRMRVSDGLIVMRVSDFQELYGTITEKEPEVDRLARRALEEL